MVDNPDTPAGGRVAAFFDVDRTLLRGSSVLHVARPMRRAGLLSARSLAHSLMVQARFSLFGFDESQILEAVRGAGDLIAGIDADDLAAFARRTIPTHVAPRVHAQARARIVWHQRQGHEVHLVSSSPEGFIAVLGGILGVDGVTATQAELAGGRYTGRILRFCHGPAKAAAVQALAAERGIDLRQSYAYGDSFAGDLAMLALVGHPIAVNADRALAAEATRRGWAQLRFDRSLRQCTGGGDWRRFSTGVARRSRPMMRRAHGHARSVARALRRL
ncbi:MAG: HAD family hydrolase [Candidatus Dormibacteria bacterium]